MGNEDVGCKAIHSDSKKISDFAEIESANKMNSGARNDDEEEESRVDFIALLPVELAEEIFQYLKPRDLASCTAVSSDWREAVNSNKLWNQLCDKKGWKQELDVDSSHFAKAHKQFRKTAHTYDSFMQICDKRLLYNKHSCLQNNWRSGKFIIHKISNGSGYLQLFEPVSCDGKYLVTQEKHIKFSQATLGVWCLNGVPYKVCNLDLPSNIHSVDAVAFDYGTIAVAQAWVIIVYKLLNNKFEVAFEKNDLRDLEPKAKLPKEIRRMTPYLKVTEESIICVPSHSHSTVDFIPIFFWDITTGDLKNTLSFDSMYYVILSAVWFDNSCYLALLNKKKRSYQIVEFGLKTAVWEGFCQTMTAEIEQIAVCKQYVLAVTKLSNPSMREFFMSRSENNTKELQLWDRTTGLILKTFEATGKSFQFVDDYLMYFDSSHVTVMNPNAPAMCSEFDVSGTISSIRAACHPSIMVIIKTGCYIEVWDWGVGCRLYTITAETGYGSQLWCDNKRIITYNSAESTGSGGILVLGFW